MAFALLFKHDRGLAGLLCAISSLFKVGVAFPQFFSTVCAFSFLPNYIKRPLSRGKVSFNF